MNIRSLTLTLAALCICGTFAVAQPVVFFSETFDNNNAGWTLDTEWAIGPAMA